MGEFGCDVRSKHGVGEDLAWSWCRCLRTSPALNPPASLSFTTLVPSTLPRRCHLRVLVGDLLCRRSSSGGELLNEGVSGLEESGALSFLGVAEDFSYTPRTTNPNFKRDRFLAACGVEYVWDIGLQDQAFAGDSHSSSSTAPAIAVLSGQASTNG